MTRLLVFLSACLLSNTVCLGWTPAARPMVATAGMKTLVGNRLRTTSLQLGEVSPVDSKDVPAIGYMKSEEIIFTDDMTDEWELDCYSRPVMGADGKKLWEILLTDSEGSFRYLKTIPSNLVNSRNLRNAVEEVMEQAPVRPKMIRFFRNQMFNMITIALSTLEVEVKPSRRTHNMFSWLTEREKNIYPKMPGYNAQLKQQTILDYDVSQPGILHNVLSLSVSGL
jgi:RNA-binding protein Tab2/Atab2